MTSLSLPNPHLFPASIARPATPEDIAILAAKLRPECDLELRASTGTDPETALKNDLGSVYVIEDRGHQPLAALIVSADVDNPRIGYLQIVVSKDVAPWRGGTHVVKSISEAVLEMHRSGMDTIHSIVDYRNVHTSKLLMGSGFGFIKRMNHFGADCIEVNLYTSQIKAAPAQLH